MTGSPMLQLDGVTKRFKRGGREHTALCDVELQLEAGELVAVWGRQRSGRTTLLQAAAGIERPSDGVVRFDGVDLEQRSMLGRPDGLAYASTRFERAIGDTALEHVAAPLLGGTMSMADAKVHAFRALRRAGVAACADLAPEELDRVDLIAVAIARALVTRPRLLLADQPTDGLAPAHERDSALELLRSLAHRDGVAVLMTVAEAADLAGADRALTIDHGELRGLTDPAPVADVIPLRGRRSRSSA